MEYLAGKSYLSRVFEKAITAKEGATRAFKELLAPIL